MKIIAIGNSALMDGFALLGIETYADASADEINAVLTDLVHEREREKLIGRVLGSSALEGQIGH